MCGAVQRPGRHHQMCGGMRVRLSASGGGRYRAGIQCEGGQAEFQELHVDVRRRVQRETKLQWLPVGVHRRMSVEGVGRQGVFLGIVQGHVQRRVCIRLCPEQRRERLFPAMLIELSLKFHNLTSLIFQFSSGSYDADDIGRRVYRLSFLSSR